MNFIHGDKEVFQLSMSLSTSILLPRRFENELVVAVGKGEPATVMSEYGFKYGFGFEVPFISFWHCFYERSPISSRPCLKFQKRSISGGICFVFREY